MLLSLYLAVLDDQSKEEQFIDVYNTYKRLVYHTAYKIMGDSYLAEDVLQEVFLYVAKNFSKIHRENCHELAAYLFFFKQKTAYEM
nr:sigma factor [Faecalibacterium prausnitzii]